MRSIHLLVPAAAAVLTLSACSGTGSVSEKDLEDTISTQMTKPLGQEPEKVDCPDGLEAKVDATQTCTLDTGDETMDVTATVTSVDGGNVKFDIETAPK